MKDTLEECDVSGSRTSSARGCDFSAAEVGAIAHLYRGEVYRSTMWRGLFDTTTNWTLVLTGVSITVTFGTTTASPLPLILVGPIVAVFLLLEARRYRYFNVWRARARLLETDFYVPLPCGQGTDLRSGWNTMLAEDYHVPRFHISYARAVGRRLRKNYIWVFLMQALPYSGKVQPVLVAGALFHLFWIAFALVTYWSELRLRNERRTLIAIV